MFVIERGGVTWGERFYGGHNYMTNAPTWGPLDRAVEYHNQSRAVSMSYRIDDEEGIYTTVESVEDFPNEEDDG
jgi:hypothetical protein